MRTSSLRVARTALLDRRYLVAFARVGAAFAGMLVQHLVEILPPHLVGVRRAFADGAREREGVVAVLVVGLEIRAGLEHAERAHLVEHAEPLEHRKIHRQQRFADVKARMVRLLERDHSMAAPRQQRRGGAAGRTAADHRDVALLARHIHRRLHQHSFDAAVVGPRHVLGQPVRSQ